LKKRKEKLKERKMRFKIFFELMGIILLMKSFFFYFWSDQTKDHDHDG
jgi:hypothetical protein